MKGAVGMYGNVCCGNVLYVMAVLSLKAVPL